MTLIRLCLSLLLHTLAMADWSTQIVATLKRDLEACKKSRDIDAIDAAVKKVVLMGH